MTSTNPPAAGWHLAKETTGRPVVWAVDPERLAGNMAAGTGAARTPSPCDEP